MRLHEGDSSIQSHGAIHLVLKDIAVVQPVRLVVVSRPTTTKVSKLAVPDFGAHVPSLLKRERAGVFRDSINMLIVWECNIQSHTLRTLRFRICAPAKRLVPPCTLIFAAFLGRRLFALLDFFLNLRTPMFHVQESTFIEHHMCISIPLEINSEGRMPYDSRKLPVWTVGNLSHPRLA